MQALSEKVRELEARLCETTEFDTLRARVRVLEEHIQNCSCGGELVGEAKVVGAKVIKGIEELEGHIVCNDVGTGGSAREYCGASSEHSGVGLSEVAEVDEADVGEKAGYSKSGDQGSSGEGTAVDAAVDDDQGEVSVGYGVDACDGLQGGRCTELNSEGKGDAGDVEVVSIVGDIVGGSSDVEVVQCVESPGGNASDGREVAGDVRVDDVGSSTDVDHRLDFEVGGDVKLSRADISQGDRGASEQGGDIVSSVAVRDGECDEGGRCKESSRKVITESKKLGDVTGQSQGYQQHLVSSYAQTALKGRDIEVICSKSGREVVGKGSKTVRTQEGTWQCVGGSRFWRPNPTGGQVTTPNSKEEGIWMMKGGSRIWRRTGDREVTTSQNQTEWITAKGGARQKSLSADTQVRVSNRFSVLQLDDQGEGECPAEEVRHLVVGDSRVRPLRRTYCGTRDKCIVKPGAKVVDIDEVIRAEMGRYKPEAIIVQVGVNDIGPRRSEKLVAEYRCLLQRLSEFRKPIIVTGILPRLRASSEWFSRALSLNNSIEMMCKTLGLGYVDLWDDFHNNNRYYLRDGLHLSDEGARVLGVGYRCAIQGNA